MTFRGRARPLNFRFLTEF